MAEPYEQEFAQALAWLKSRTPEQRRELLRSAGILDAHGQLSERFVPPEEYLRETRRLAATGADLRLHSSAFHEPGPWYVTMGESLTGRVVGWGKTPAEAVDAALRTVATGPGVTAR